MSSPFAGKWKLHSSENFDEFLKVMGAPWMIRKMANVGSASLEITVNGDHFVIKTVTSMKSKDTQFTLGQEFEDETMDKRTMKKLITKESETKLVERARVDGTEIVTIREVVGNELVVTSEAKGVKTTRRFRRE